MYRDCCIKYILSALTLSCGPKYRARETDFNCMRFENEGQASMLQACSLLAEPRHFIRHQVRRLTNLKANPRSDAEH